MLAPLGGDVAAEGVGVLGTHGEPDLGAGVRADRVAQLAGSWARCWWAEDEGEAVAPGLGEELFEAAGRFWAFVDVEGAVDPGGLAEAGPVGGGLPDGGDDEAAEEAGGVVAEEAFGQACEEGPAVRYLADVDAGVAAADDLAGEVGQQERPELVHERADDLALGGGAEHVVPAPEPAETDRVAGNGGDLGGTRRKAVGARRPTRPGHLRCRCGAG
ncbi:hypothetical protein [Acidiferrimicrobium sp. IK]|uniref:hypothetical protein n=1 Tax=Acidiferrimicrobium sp. IK TaxID=2871700 RepID=UPI0021CB47DE|nr:hypothetical protein [Acidiferrimicrobium sp. IK]